jgi:hypothetical protein
MKPPSALTKTNPIKPNFESERMLLRLTIKARHNPRPQRRQPSPGVATLKMMEASAEVGVQRGGYHL